MSQPRALYAKRWRMVRVAVDRKMPDGTWEKESEDRPLCEFVVWRGSKTLGFLTKKECLAAWRRSA